MPRSPEPHDTCPRGRALASHPRCACRTLVGCQGEPALTPGGVCAFCAAEGARAILKRKRTARPFYTPGSAAELLGLSRATILRKIKAGELPATLMRPTRAAKGQRWCIPRAAVEAERARLHGPAPGSLSATTGY